MVEKSIIVEDIILKKGKEFKLSDFDIIKELGHGAYAKVYLATYKEDKKEYALKVIQKYNIVKENKLYQIHLESDLLLILNDEYFAKLYGAFEENKKLILVMDYYKNGDLFDFISLNSKLSFNF